jgi:hypothetical protein
MDRALLDEFFGAEDFRPEVLLGSCNNAYHGERCAARLKKVVISGTDRQAELITGIDHPLLNICLALRLARLTPLLAYWEKEATNGLIYEAVVMKAILASHQYVAESLEAGAAPKFLQCL